ncbi:MULTISPECIES: PAS domain S-box protein [Cyanophyceae]|uniref:PAS domain S-box protein n=1 Tax=Cyanophyceae TaxID=3028117 RepID=UPI0016892534|nr:MULTISPECIES: PAS domain S-box protein [Cyanophyceae]MBD1914596.1 PAS domain S-box protein [Phormidium sp. FACHB-77]MBD2030320.1 PAS domain S-box protein [Phormidium sp. FACHB-322]MBD2049865.1 PAS domain S-box protein [Leptolyngbya sp. FACHB-60]
MCDPPATNPDACEDEDSLGDSDNPLLTASFLEPVAFQQQLHNLGNLALSGLCAAIAGLNHGVVLCDCHRTITVLNGAARKLLGLGTSAPTASHLTASVDLYILGDRTPLHSEQVPLWRALSGERVDDLELAIVQTNGDRYLVLASAQPIFSDDQSVCGAVMSLHDITARHRSRAALQASNQGLRTQAQERLEDLQAINQQLQEEIAQRQKAEATLRLFYDLPFLGMAIIAADTTTWLRFNDRLCEILGYSRDELSQVSWAELIHPEDQAQDQAQFAQMTTGTLQDCVLETRLIRKDSLVVYTCIDIKGVAGADGSPDFYVTTVKDITEHKLAEAALVESEARFRTTFEQAAVGIAHLNLDGVLLWLNPVLGDILGTPYSELLGESLNGMIHLDDRAEDRMYCEALLRGDRQSYSRQQRYICPNGRLIWANLTVSLVHDASQQPRYFIAVLQDITVAIETETTLQQYAHRLRGLHAMDRAILTNFKSQDIAQSALLLLGQILCCSQGLVTLFDHKATKGSVIATIGNPLPSMGEPDTARPLADSMPEQGAKPLEVRGPSLLGQAPAPPILQRWATIKGSTMTVPLVSNGKPIGEIVLVSPAKGHFTNDHKEVAHQVADHLAIALQNAQLFEQVKHDRTRLQSLSRQLLEAQETERRFLAHELHDEIGQALTAVNLNLHRLDRMIANPQIDAPLQDCLAIVDGALQQVRNLSLDLRPSMLDDLGLVPALRWYINRHAERSGLQEILVCRNIPHGLLDSTETACFRIVQEALTNIARHAQATAVTVTIEQVDQTLHLTVEDNGLGFDVATVDRAKTEGTSLGLLGMEERSKLIGGHLTIASSPGQGTCIHLQLPLAELTID